MLQLRSKIYKIGPVSPLRSRMCRRTWPSRGNYEKSFQKQFEGVTFARLHFTSRGIQSTLLWFSPIVGPISIECDPPNSDRRVQRCPYFRNCRRGWVETLCFSNNVPRINSGGYHTNMKKILRNAPENPVA